MYNKRCALFTQNLHRKGKSTCGDGFGCDDRGVDTTKRVNANNTKKKKNSINDPHKLLLYELSWAKLEMRLLAKRSDGSL